MVGRKRPHLDAATSTKRNIAKKVGEIKINIAYRLRNRVGKSHLPLLARR